MRTAHTRTHTYYIHKKIHTYIHTYLLIYIHTHLHTYTCTILTYMHTHTCIHTYIHTYVHTYVHAYTYVHTYVDTHTYAHRTQRACNRWPRSSPLFALSLSLSLSLSLFLSLQVSPSPHLMTVRRVAQPQLRGGDPHGVPIARRFRLRRIRSSRPPALAHSVALLLRSVAACPPWRVRTCAHRISRQTPNGLTRVRICFVITYVPQNRTLWGCQCRRFP